MNSDQIQGKWKQLSGSFREKFGKFTNDDLERLTGQSEQLIGQLQEKYGDTREEAERRYTEWGNSLKDYQEAKDASLAASKHPS
jgi:uncharacterized protein YjbJ (UPF0337 family)